MGSGICCVFSRREDGHAAWRWPWESYRPKVEKGSSCSVIAAGTRWPGRSAWRDGHPDVGSRRSGLWAIAQDSSQTESLCYPALRFRGRSSIRELTGQAAPSR